MPSTTAIAVIDPSNEVVGSLETILPAISRTRLDSWPLDQPHEPAETLALLRAYVVTTWSGDPTRLLVASEDGEVLGHVVLELPMHDNQHVGLAEFHVALGCRRRGVGRRLLDATVEVLREQGRSTLITEAREGSAMERFAEAVGATCRNVDVRRHQPVAELDLDRVETLRRQAASRAVGYRLDAWQGTTPPGLRDEMARVTLSLNDAPLGELDYDDEVWDAERVELRDRFVTASGLRLHTVTAFAPDGGAAGFTEVAVSADGTYGWQWNTGVDPAHRGHRLGLLLKATMVARLRALEPALEVVSTWNAGGNEHMIAINEALGYVPVDRMGEWQLDFQERAVTTGRPR